ncbi:hypothetical protein KCV01_g21497, partial [Aureobasidium melanogenum]
LDSLVHAADHPTALDTSHDGCEVECVGQRPGLDQWLKLHYIPVGAPSWGPAADTLELVTAEFGLSALADRLGDKATSRRFLERAQYWRNLFDPKATTEGGYIRNRNADGSWALVKDDDKEQPHAFTPSTEDGFVEGSAAQYVWMVPFNVRGLFDAMGGADKARKRLDAFFYKPDGAFAVTNSGPLHAELNNEPSIGSPWLYNFAGQPWKTQELVRRVQDTIWLNAPNGIPGNDDLGEMSSWYVFSALGIYPSIPGRAEMIVGSPLFTKATIHREGGDVTILAPNAGQGRPYVHGLKVDGKASDRAWLPESFALKGGKLEFDLSDKPNTQSAPCARQASRKPVARKARSYISDDRSLNAFATTDTELRLIANAAIIGDSVIPSSGYNTPAASGTPTAFHRQRTRPHDAREIALEQRHRRAFDGDIATVTHADADIGRRQRRCVVHAVAGHRHGATRRLQLRDHLRLVLRRRTGMHLVDRQRRRHGLRRRLAVAGKHHQTHALRMQSIQRRRRGRLDRIRQRKHAGKTTIHRQEHRRRALQPPLLNERTAGTDIHALMFHQARIAHRHVTTIDTATDTAPHGHLEPR